VSEKIDSFLEAFFLPSFLLSIRCFFGNILGCLLVVFFHFRLSSFSIGVFFSNVARLFGQKKQA